MVVTVGQRLRCEGCTTEVIVVRAPAGDVELSCEGRPLVAADGDPPAAAAASSGGAREAEGTLLGKRYADASGDLELLCTKAGGGPLAIAGEPLEVRQAKNLPSSD